MNELEYDQFLKIQSASGLQALSNTIHQNRYEATPYAGLELLCENYPMKRSDELVDFGCGKGRVSFYLHHTFGLSVTGIEVNGQLFQAALENQSAYLEKKKKITGSVRFERCLAEEYPIEKGQNIFYFFNPFSIQIFMKVISNIQKSIEKHPRTVDLIFYYPTAEYIHFLFDRTSCELLMDIKIPGFYEKDENERFVVFRIKGKS
ncbi:SAM-dependent methyltransferase [Jeotgalibacillus proteolyticus]|uniref:SAM-dependent methyltransferase n=1 Tax=Jeotgalibacillus proteolyticus TaxID=2082395 RepID=A0A2S5G8G7_9BACL|nr:methyltransferase [Jeotgalibacillus proteolyticus]PPA69286.1 SAM-dependent methyltransferase [Jeotgalibacillus proteolyticus]